MNRWRGEARDLYELVLLPGLAAIMPWRLGFRMLRRLAEWLRPYEAACAGAQAQAQALGWVGDARHWRRVRRLVTLVDHADLYLARTRSDRWMADHLDVQGQWPPAGQPGVICTFHWGAGMWGLRHARAAGLKAHALVALPSAIRFAGRTVFQTYARARAAEVARATGCPALDTSQSLRPALRALRSGDQVMAAIDVPSDQVSASVDIALLGRVARVPRGLLRLAVEQRLPITVYHTGLNVETGRRLLRIHSLGVIADVDEAARQVFDFLDAAVRENPPAWHFWGEAERLFRADAPDQRGGPN